MSDKSERASDDYDNGLFIEKQFIRG